jgi:hypothetical protein
LCVPGEDVCFTGTFTYPTVETPISGYYDHFELGVTVIQWGWYTITSLPATYPKDPADPDDGNNGPPVDVDYDIKKHPGLCQYTLSTDIEFKSDTISEVVIEQTYTGTFSDLCGTCTTIFTHGEDSHDITAANPKHSWNLASVTGDYHFGVKTQCSNVADPFTESVKK